MLPSKVLISLWPHYSIISAYEKMYHITIEVSSKFELSSKDVIKSSSLNHLWDLTTEGVTLDSISLGIHPLCIDTKLAGALIRNHLICFYMQRSISLLELEVSRFEFCYTF